MTVLRLVSLVVIAGICVSIFAIVYPYLQGMSAAQQAEEAASKLETDIQWVILNEDSRTKEYTIPSGYTLSLENSDGVYKIEIDGMYFPEDGFDKSVKFENIKHNELSSGIHELHMELKNDLVVVSKVG
ncbi:hypothetical protein AKJ46_00715 [candidate division MSBL1 archaeon SCGC-AAA833K04]|uniref:Uncharacterized protein n=1 Tax=candidate division MSBL1 archaeon SCGC-AAA833K04 TaxID=1698258 RepID=A0A133VS36_9EURY|nr:hypothetical protein AKJ46_00715 [candidate division MSBL1 archaeon SCGC-AAA833K04]